MLIPGATAVKVAHDRLSPKPSGEDGRGYCGRGCGRYAAGRDEGRTDSALLGAGLGGALGAGVGGFLTKSADEVAKIKEADTKKLGVGGAIGGDQVTSGLVLLGARQALKTLVPVRESARSTLMMMFSLITLWLGEIGWIPLRPLG